MANTQEKIINILTKYSKVELPISQIKPDTHLLEDLKINSARLVDIIIDFEDAFEVEIDDDSADLVNTVGDAFELIEKLKTAA